MRQPKRGTAITLTSTMAVRFSERDIFQISNQEKSDIDITVSDARRHSNDEKSVTRRLSVKIQKTYEEECYINRKKKNRR